MKFYCLFVKKVVVKYQNKWKWLLNQDEIIMTITWRKFATATSHFSTSTTSEKFIYYFFSLPFFIKNHSIYYQE
ncbi:MAG: hypothetical protein DRN11_04475 [Thermoplasmata archaeon]|nr:MAG: hypothetical protein DRN11_04475 [Thermoplasmata archaeon]